MVQSDLRGIYALGGGYVSCEERQASVVFSDVRTARGVYDSGLRVVHTHGGRGL